MTSFGRLVTAMATPFTEAGQVDYAQAVAVERWGILAHGVDDGADGLCVLPGGFDF